MTIKDLLKVYNGKAMIRQGEKTIYIGFEVPEELLDTTIVTIKPTAIAGEGMMWIFI